MSDLHQMGEAGTLPEKITRSTLKGDARDQQRSKVYQAETVLKEFSSPLKGLHAVQQYVNHVTSLNFWRKNRPHQYTIIVTDNPRCRNAHAGHNHINIPKWAQHEWIVLHELAHILSWKAKAPHNWQYCQIYLRLIRNRLGFKAFLALRESFRKHRVKYNAGGTQRASRRRERPCKDCGQPTRATYCGSCFKAKVAAKLPRNTK